MLEGVLKDFVLLLVILRFGVSILGMLEGVLKASAHCGLSPFSTSFNPWYVGGGVKSDCLSAAAPP